MKRLPWVIALGLCFPVRAWALDPIDANGAIACPQTGESFNLRGDSWSFLPGASCRDNASEPLINDAKLDAVAQGTADTKKDLPGHCLWVFFANDGPQCKTGGCDGAFGERARKLVFASMRKWAGYKAGNQTLGDLEWNCPSPSVPDNSTTSLKTSLDYTFGLSNAKPSFAYYRGHDIAPTVSDGGATSLNKGDDSDCFSECAPSQNCSALEPLSPQQTPPLYKCAADLTDTSKNRFRFKSVRNTVIWVKGASNWTDALGYSEATLAVTETVYWPDNGVAVTSDLLFNNQNIDWNVDDLSQAGGQYTGCDTGQNTCYYLETVATHEAGHFIGLGHIDCADAVMYKSAASSDQRFGLSKHDLAGVCALYRPSSEGRFPTKSRENEGCFSDADCTGGSGLKCLFSQRSFYANASVLASATMASRIAHRGICVRTAPCLDDSECEPDFGRVCQGVTESESYCLPGSKSRPATTTTDLCVTCSEGSDCLSGVCVSTDAMGVAAQSRATPDSICTTRCRPASGCPYGFSCEQVQSQYVCKPNNVDQCLKDAEALRADLYEVCDATKPCAPGLSCFRFDNGDQVCLERCSPSKSCKTPGYGCYYSNVDGQPSDSDEGACFKKDMREGDSCGVPSSVVCGLNCESKNGVETCQRVNRGCFVDPNAAPTASEASAHCYALCSAQVACPAQGQQCVLDEGAQVGVCALTNMTCLLDAGQTCTLAAECSSGQCLDFQLPSLVCSSFCDLSTGSGCPSGLSCVDYGGGQGACKPDAGPIASRCASASSAGCSCRSTDSSANDVAGLAVCLVLFLWLKRRRISG